MTPTTEATVIVEKTQQPVVVASRRLLVFTPDGMPELQQKNLDNVNKQIVDKVNFSALLLPYRGEKVYDINIETNLPLQTFTYHIPEEFEGLTNLEVASIRAAEQAASGDFNVYHKLLERLAGKSVEKSMQVSTKMDYKDFLETLEQKDLDHINDSILELL